MTRDEWRVLLIYAIYVALLVTGYVVSELP
jgi:hypothetical protein